MLSKRLVWEEFHIQPVIGDIGVEVEVEGDRLPAEINNQWRVTNDGSLRGMSYEYVFAKPLSLTAGKKAIADLYSKLEEKGVVVANTGRAGVHVHVNFTTLSVNTALVNTLLFLLIERPLINYCGDDRKSNAFCLGSDQAEYLVQRISSAIEHSRAANLQTDDLRYAAINLNSLFKYGSIEYRCMRAPVEQEALVTWVDTLVAIRDAVAKDIHGVVKTIMEAPSEDVGMFLADILPDSLLKDVPLDVLTESFLRRRSELTPLLINFHTRFSKMFREIKRPEHDVKVGDVYRSVVTRVLFMVKKVLIPNDPALPTVVTLRNAKGLERSIPLQRLALRYTKEV